MNLKNCMQDVHKWTTYSAYVNEIIAKIKFAMKFNITKKLITFQHAVLKHPSIVYNPRTYEGKEKNWLQSGILIYPHQHRHILLPSYAFSLLCGENGISFCFADVETPHSPYCRARRMPTHCSGSKHCQCIWKSKPFQVCSYNKIGIKMGFKTVTSAWHAGDPTAQF